MDDGSSIPEIIAAVIFIAMPRAAMLARIQVLLLASSTAAGWVADRVAASIVGRPSAIRGPASYAPIMTVSLSRTSLAAAAAAASTPESLHASSVLSRFLSQFRGHFDNHEQVETEKLAGLTPREGGGHEHIHCSLQPVTLHDRPQGQYVLASYYFNGDPDAVFRERLYAFDELPRDPQFGTCVRMRIYKMRLSTAERLRAGMTLNDVAWSAAEDLHASLHVPEADVFWRWCGERFEGSMRTQSIEIISERSGRAIRVRDDVALWQDALWVNDRATDAETGAYVYGNIHDIPYKMARVNAE
jgi:hypothetical protein